MYVLRIVAKNLILPPAGPLLLAAVGFGLRRRSPRAGTAIAAGALIVLAVLAMPACSDALLRSVDAPPPLPAGDAWAEAEAIVILGGDRRLAPELGGGDLGPMTLARVRYGAHLHRATGLPVLVTGDGAREDVEPSGVLMARVLEEEFRVPVRWIESASRNTAENAILSASLLRAAGVDSVYLVTTAFHMRRAVEAFEAVGLRVVPAPTDNPPPGRGVSALDFVPTADALMDSSLALHEWLGRAWYGLVRAFG